MFPSTLFPAIRAAMAINATVKHVRLSDRDHLVVSLNGKVVGKVVEYPHGAASDVEVGQAHCDAISAAFRAQGFSDPHENLIPLELRGKVDLQVFCRQLIQEQGLFKTVKRQAKTQILWVCRDCKPGEYWKIKYPAFDENARQAIKTANCAQTILFFVNDDIADL